MPQVDVAEFHVEVASLSRSADRVPVAAVYRLYDPWVTALCRSEGRT